MVHAPFMLLALAATVLQGCGAGAVIVYDGSRQASKPLIGQALAETAPGIDQDAGAECIIAAMSYAEIIGLGTSDSRFVTDTYRSKVAEVRQRAGVEDCLATAAGQGA
jgi:hypothetical protein